jgi:hypothetical protein
MILWLDKTVINHASGVAKYRDEFNERIWQKQFAPAFHWPMIGQPQEFYPFFSDFIQSLTSKPFKRSGATFFHTNPRSSLLKNEGASGHPNDVS